MVKRSKEIKREGSLQKRLGTENISVGKLGQVSRHSSARSPIEGMFSPDEREYEGTKKKPLSRAMSKAGMKAMYALTRGDSMATGVYDHKPLTSRSRKNSPSPMLHR